MASYNKVQSLQCEIAGGKMKVQDEFGSCKVQGALGDDKVLLQCEIAGGKMKMRVNLVVVRCRVH